MLRKIRNIVFSLLAVFIIVLASVSALVETETGSRWVVARLASVAGITIGEMSGNLRTGLDVSFIDYNDGKQHYRAEQVSFRWHPAALLYSTLAVQSLQAKNILIQLPPSAPMPAPAEPFSQWPSLGLPVAIKLDQLQLINIKFVQGSTELLWNKLSGSLSHGQFKLRYNNLALLHDDYLLNLTGASDLAFPYATKANLQWHWQAPATETQLAQTQPASPPAQVQQAAQQQSSTSTSAASSASAIAAAENLPALVYEGTTVIEGDLSNLKLSNKITSPVLLDADASAQLVNAKKQLQTEPLMTLALNWKQQTLPAQWWMPAKPAPVTSGKVTASGNWRSYKVQVDGDISLPNTPSLAIVATAAGDLEKIQIDELLINELLPVPSPEVVATASSEATAVEKVDQIVADAVANKENATEETIAAVKSDTGLSLKGSVKWLPDLQWQIDANAQHLDLASLVENWPSDLNATFSTSGKFADELWNAELTNLHIDGEMRGVNVQGDGSIKFDGKNISSDSLHIVFGANQLQVNGSMGEAFSLDWNLNAPILQQLDDRVTGSVASVGQLRGDWEKPRMSATASAEKFKWGSYGVDKLELSLAPQGSVANANGAGTNNSPEQADESAEETELSITQAQKKQSPTAVQQDPQTQITTQEAVAVVADALRNEDYDLAFSANQLHVGENYFSTIKLNGSGSLNKHQLQSTIRSTAYGRADIKVVGAFDGTEWQGTLEQLAIKLKKVPRWWLKSSKPIRVNANSVVLGAQCLTTRSNLTAAVERSELVEREQLVNDWLPNQSRVTNTYDWLVSAAPLPASGIERYALPQLCIHGDWASTDGAKFTARVDSVPLRQFLSLFKTEVYFAGVMDGYVNLTSKTFALNDTEVSANISTRNAELRYQYAGGITEVYAWKDFAARADLKKAQLNAVAGMEWVGYGTLNATTHLDLAQQKIVDGKMEARFTSLAPLETLLTFANDVKGDFRADLFASGSFAQPQVLGEISLRNGVANIPGLGVDLTNIDLQINSTQAGNINLVSQLQSGKGKLSLVGDLNQFGTPNWTVQGFINGSDFQVVNLQQLKATLSPDIKITANSEAISLSGDAVIPWARANIKRLPETATAVSRDAVIVDENFSQSKSSIPITLFTNLNLSLGNDVQFQGFGLNSKLSGKVNLLKEAQRPFFTNGYVSVSDGSYKAYGQSLTIERGRLIFQGPYENPGLDIRASRVIKGDTEYQVGLEIGGTLQRPKADIFSVPSKSESDAMMMLLTGKPVNEATKADASMLLGAMSGLGMDSNSSITTEITQALHLDELEIKSDDGINQSQLWIGKYLTPKLLVRYVVGIFDRAFSLGMEYRLSEHLRLEAESGESQSVDIVYKIER
ncbi:MAG: translocation/assembly module TamB domain-containing protein [Cellvibrio sp.]|uniref:translocation/assembly module TamB domain-containing protein n=1 Tax=Cellvibrio sp. TaxID=1965322 RepID=UPI0031A16AF4